MVVRTLAFLVLRQVLVAFDELSHTI